MSWSLNDYKTNIITSNLKIFLLFVLDNALAILGLESDLIFPTCINISRLNLGILVGVVINHPGCCVTF